MDADTEQLIKNATALYEPVLTGGSVQMRNSSLLWQQFQSAIEACIAGAAGCERQLSEKINEMATAKVLVEDHTIEGEFFYEPDILPSGRKIDFVVERANDNLYVEVKTVRPETPDTEVTWARYQELRRFHPRNVNFIVKEDWMGGMIYGNTFASRSKFLQYSLAFEKRLDEAQGVAAGPGVLVFCGTGFQWNVTDLEDFSDFYRYGKHRADDPFALMEEHEIVTKQIELRRNISDFSFIQRRNLEAEVRKVFFPVRGPIIGR